MRQIFSLSEQLTDEEVVQLTALLLFHLVEKCGGHVEFTPDDANKTAPGLSTKMVHMQVGKQITLRIVTRPPELQEIPDET
ncbi:MAG: hypothetical protein C4293_01460 [Nitrospiraceae bacterium]